MCVGKQGGRVRETSAVRGHNNRPVYRKAETRGSPRSYQSAERNFAGW